MEKIFSDEDLAAHFKQKRGTLAVVCDSDSDIPWTEAKLESLRVTFVQYTPESDARVIEDFTKRAVKHRKGKLMPKLKLVYESETPFNLSRRSLPSQLKDPSISAGR